MHQTCSRFNAHNHRLQHRTLPFSTRKSHRWHTSNASPYTMQSIAARVLLLYRSAAQRFRGRGLSRVRRRGSSQSAQTNVCGLLLCERCLYTLHRFVSSLLFRPFFFLSSWRTYTISNIFQSQAIFPFLLFLEHGCEVPRVWALSWNVNHCFLQKRSMHYFDTQCIISTLLFFAEHA